MSTNKPKIHIPTPEEDAALTAAAMSDPDNLPLTDAQLVQFKPARPRGRPAMPKEEKKVATSVRIDPQVLQAYKATGAGWQNRMGEALRVYAMEHHMLPTEA